MSRSSISRPKVQPGGPPHSERPESSSCPELSRPSVLLYVVSIGERRGSETWLLNTQSKMERRVVQINLSLSISATFNLIQNTYSVTGTDVANVGRVYIGLRTVTASTSASVLAADGKNLLAQSQQQKKKKKKKKKRARDSQMSHIRLLTSGL